MRTNNFRVSMMSLAFVAGVSNLAMAQPTQPQPVPATQFNRWYCFVDSTGPEAHQYFGYSNWFPAGSGQGQAAHARAYESALSQCELAHPQQCVSDFTTDCAVEHT